MVEAAVATLPGTVEAATMALPDAMEKEKVAQPLALESQEPDPVTINKDGEAATKGGAPSAG